MSATIDDLISVIRKIELSLSNETLDEEKDNELREILEKKYSQLNDAISISNNSKLLKG